MALYLACIPCLHLLGSLNIEFSSAQEAQERQRVETFFVAFLLKHVEGLSYEEMSELTGAGVSALKMRVKRACDRLRGLLQEAYSA